MCGPRIAATAGYIQYSKTGWKRANPDEAVHDELLHLVLAGPRSAIGRAHDS